VPADDQGEHGRASCAERGPGDPALREQAVRRYAARPTEPARPELAGSCPVALRAVALFAGAEPGRDGKTTGGLQAISDFMEANVPEAERARAGEVLIRILNGTLFELAQMSRERRRPEAAGARRRRPRPS
jgi:cytochrome c biogenesis protein